MLNLSIESVKKHFEPSKIIVAEDKKDPIVNKREGIKYITRKNGSSKLYGLENVKEIHRCFEKASRNCEYVQKIDSDILCLSRHCYDVLENERPDAYGGLPMANLKMVPPKHFGGGTYFIKSSLAQKLCEENVSKAIGYWGFLGLPEDMATSFLLTNLTDNVKVEGSEMSGKGKFYFDVFLSGGVVGKPEKEKEFGFAHCRSNLHTMKKIYGNH